MQSEKAREHYDVLTCVVCLVQRQMLDLNSMIARWQGNISVPGATFADVHLQQVVLKQAMLVQKGNF